MGMETQESKCTILGTERIRVGVACCRRQVIRPEVPAVQNGIPKSRWSPQIQSRDVSLSLGTCGSDLQWTTHKCFLHVTRVEVPSVLRSGITTYIALMTSRSFLACQLGQGRQDVHIAGFRCSWMAYLYRSIYKPKMRVFFSFHSIIQYVYDLIYA